MANVIDLHREVSLGLLKSTSAFAVRTPKGQKDPGHFSWDPKANCKEESDRVIKALERNNDNLGIHLHGRVVDIDIDSDDPYLAIAIDHFLPYTAHVWGRASRPRTHRLYEVVASMGLETVYTPHQFPFLRTLNKDDRIKVEVRGGELKSGQYSLLPGSIHPSGEAYEWADLKAARSSPVAVDLYKLVDAIRYACVAALVARYWTSGNRNALCMAITGFMHRAAAHVVDMGAASTIHFRKEDAKALLEGIMKVADDEPADYTMRMKTFESTWEKADEGHPVTGASTLVKLTGDETLLSELYALLADSADLLEFDTFLERYAVRNGTSNIVDIDKAGAKGSPFIMTVADFRNSNMHRTITVGDGERKQMTNLLMASNRAIRVDGLAFQPGEDRLIERPDGKYVNQWRGFEIEPWPHRVQEHEVETFLQYLKHIVCHDNEKEYEWVTAWIADIFKFPSEKCGTALVLVGRPGSGKSFLGTVIRKIIGSNHSAQFNKIESLTGTYNSDSAGTVFVQCDEATNSRRRADASILKSMITDRTRRVEPKFVIAYQMEDCTRYFFTSNDKEDAIAVVDGRYDRRYTILQTNEDYAFRSEIPTDVKTAYWEALHEWVGDRDNLARLHRYFFDLVYDRKLVRGPLETKARMTIQQHSQRGLDDWLMDLVSMEHPFHNLPDRSVKFEESYSMNHKTKKYEPALTEWPDMVAYGRLQESYDHYRRRKGSSSSIPSYNAQQIKAAFESRGLLPLKNMTARVAHTYEEWQDGKVIKMTKYIRITELPSKKKIEEFLYEHYGFNPIREGEDVTDQVEAGHTVLTKQPDF